MPENIENMSAVLNERIDIQDETKALLDKLKQEVEKNMKPELTNEK